MPTGPSEGVAVADVQAGSCRIDDCWLVTEETAGRRRETVAEEVPVALIYNGTPFAVMLATPADLDDFGRGFSLTEGVVGSLADIESIAVVPVSRGIEVRVAIGADWALALATRKRALAGRTGCGLCGVDQFSEALRPVARVTAPLVVAPAAVRRAIAELPGLQALNQRVGAVHAAAFADASGRILALREDVGRHNALDKLIGALPALGIDPAEGFVMVSSRCSYEMVHKTAAAGIGLIAAVSAPTSLAVGLAAKANVALLGFARDGRFTVYAGAERIAGADLHE
ncbi:MAG: formate dehydrogenase accessory sulfurtransferase FdhD [Rhodoplanes sp.]|uniref:formate dehydrogenase accessory sulfurtransferase FdhD n=1 Tax=Rhodoplanes sp. TaxID=1968906 RepID=UPI0018349BBE|nr:formate dehydrogenase accessory sulfurtransferase FdhD [Rhodoplanes sp.]NVO17793.1 formate dehydrogenase accessory sulfurtransferase FdhD [Rhodoplanes sp.]